MKTIFITIPWFSPAYKAGGPVQSIANLVKLFTGNVEYKIFCSDCDLNNEPLKNISTGQWVKYNEHTEVWYAKKNNRSETLLQQVKLLKPDILYIIGLYDWHFNIVPLMFCEAPKKIVSVRGMLHPGALSEKAFKKKVFLQAWKLFRLHKKVTFHATDTKEEEYCRDIFGSSVKINVAGNFPRQTFPLENIPKQYGHLKLLSIALISPMKNHLLVLNALKQTQYKVRYDIYGPVKDAEYWQLCEQVIKSLPPNIRVKYHSHIEPEFVPAVLQQSEVFILPSKSENFGHSIIEALGAGLPVITSKNTPWNGLEERGAGMNVELTEDAVAAAIETFVKMDKAQFRPYPEAAVAYAAAHTNLEQLNSQYKNMFGL